MIIMNLMKVNGLTAVSTQESRIPVTNHARDAMAPFIRSCDRTSTDWLQAGGVRQGHVLT